VKLYGYWRSSSAWRVRIALAFKGLAYENVPVHLVRGGGEQFSDVFRGRNPISQVPVLEIERGGKPHRITQSIAIIEYLDEIAPEPPLLPRDPLERARVRELAELVNSGIQPLQNRLLMERIGELGGDAKAFAGRFVASGLAALEVHAALSSGRYLVGDEPTLADIYLVPQLYNARRLSVALEPYPRLRAVELACELLPAFASAHPDRQPDAELPPST
jgi:maleylpyruvate isomerase